MSECHDPCEQLHKIAETRGFLAYEDRWVRAWANPGVKVEKDGRARLLGDHLKHVSALGETAKWARVFAGRELWAAIQYDTRNGSVCMCVCMYVCECVCMCVFVCVCRRDMWAVIQYDTRDGSVRTCMYICMCVCMYVCLCLYADSV
jgi:hypothetical protein